MRNAPHTIGIKVVILCRDARLIFPDASHIKGTEDKSPRNGQTYEHISPKVGEVGRGSYEYADIIKYPIKKNAVRNEPKVTDAVGTTSSSSRTAPFTDRAVIIEITAETAKRENAIAGVTFPEA